MCVCIALCTTVGHNIAQNRPDNFPSYPLDNHHCSDDVYLREGGRTDAGTALMAVPASSAVPSSVRHLSMLINVRQTYIINSSYAFRFGLISLRIKFN